MQRRALTFALVFVAPTFLPVLALSSTSTSPLSLEGKRALVTGSSGGIGAGIALALAAQGASVLVHYNSRHEGAKQTCAAITKQAQSAEGGKGLCEGIIQCDFRSPKAIDKMMGYIGENCWEGQPLDILVNNAGLITKMASDDDDEDLSAWHDTMAVNLHAPLQLSRLAHRQMKTGGAGIALALAAQGASVLVHYNSRHEGAKQTCAAITKQAQSAEGGKGLCEGIIQCDFRSPKAIDKMMGYIGENCWEGQPLDILVNNAGLITKMASDDDDEDLSAWHDTMAVNLHAPLQLSRLAHRQMKTGGNGGVIVNVSSIHGSRSVEWMTAYAASKAALDSLTRGLALEYADDNVRVNAVAPGIVPVERTAAVLSTKEAQDMWTPHLPVGRMGSVGEIGEATVQLCTNQWMTGTVLSIDGGMMARANMPFRPRPPVPEPKSASGSDVDEVCQDVTFERP